MPNIYEYKNLANEVKDVSKKDGIVTGYFSSFGTIDAYNDVVIQGAFTKTIAEQGPNSSHPRIKHLLDHDTYLSIGKLMVLKEDATGLYYESKIGSHALGQDFIKMVESGLITEHSIGFRTVKSSMDDNTGIRTLNELQLFEGSSLRSWGVNQNTPLLNLKGENQEDRLDRLAKLEKFARNSDATDETIEMLLLEIKQLTQLTIDLKTTKPTEEVTKPGINWNRVAMQLLQ